MIRGRCGGRGDCSLGFPAGGLLVGECLGAQITPLLSSSAHEAVWGGCIDWREREETTKRKRPLTVRPVGLGILDASLR